MIPLFVFEKPAVQWTLVKGHTPNYRTNEKLIKHHWDFIFSFLVPCIRESLTFVSPQLLVRFRLLLFLFNAPVKDNNFQFYALLNYPFKGLWITLFASLSSFNVLSLLLEVFCVCNNTKRNFIDGKNTPLKIVVKTIMHEIHFFPNNFFCYKQFRLSKLEQRYHKTQL